MKPSQCVQTPEQAVSPIYYNPISQANEEAL